jgi:hypothetical protein
MPLAGVLTLSLALASGAAGDRVLLCRPRVAGDPALARAEAIAQAVRKDERFLDYGVVCEDAAESARAARRMGLAHAISATAEGRGDASRYVLVLADSEGEARRAERSVDVAPGGDPVRPLRSALSQLLGTLPPKPGPSKARIAQWSLVGTGAAAIVAGAVFATQARDAAQRANAAGSLGAHVEARRDWERRRTASGALLGVGGAALAAGLVWRFAF